MTYRPHRMKFGVFLAPFHPLNENPTLAIDRDIDLLVHLDRLGFDEAWIGEHHSAGWEIIADPALIIAAAAPRTRSIRLGTGVTSLPYHHPLIVADRMVQLDHMTRGRAMLGVGPGALTSDAYMMGIEPSSQRQRMAEALDAIMALFRSDEPVTMETDWFTLRDARLQLAHYSEPHLPVAVAHSFSPAGPTAAGKFGIGMLSTASSQPRGIELLAESWSWAEEAARESGQALSRDDWRVVLPFHLAESREQAIEEARDGALSWNADYFVGTLGRPSSGQDDLESMMARGGAIVGTPDDAIEAIENILEQSGGFGGFLGLAHEWASLREETWRSYELWARHVAPHFQNQLGRPKESQQFVAGHGRDIFGPPGEAVKRAFDDAGIAIPEGQEHRFHRGTLP